MMNNMKEKIQLGDFIKSSGFNKKFINENGYSLTIFEDGISITDSNGKEEFFNFILEVF